jgi:hypothetical protein
LYLKSAPIQLEGTMWASALKKDDHDVQLEQFTLILYLYFKYAGLMFGGVPRTLTL